MLDRLAKAAEEAAEYDNDIAHEILSADYVSNWPEVVRAVLREMRDNLDVKPMEMFYRAYERPLSPERWESPFSNGWEALIDTILEEQ